jgi:hypothetical protein
MTYTTRKLSKSRVAIFKDGEELCQLRPAEVRGWIIRAEASDAKDAAWESERRARRLEIVREYLSARAAREASVPKQLNLF